MPNPAIGQVSKEAAMSDINFKPGTIWTGKAAKEGLAAQSKDEKGTA